MTTKQELDRHSEHDMGKQAGPQYHSPNGQSGADLSRQISVQLTSQQFEELYLQPSQKSRQQGELIKALGNPTVLGIICFILNLMPTSMVLMGFRGTSASGTLGMIGVYYFVGGLGMVIAGLLEFLIGNTFPFVVFFTFGVFWLSLGIYTDPTKQISTLLANDAIDLYCPWGFYLLVWAIYVFMLTFAAIRTNIVLVWILFHVAMTLLMLAAGYINLGNLATAVAGKILIAAGAFGFLASLGGLYILFHLLLAANDFPFNVPLGDLSGILKKKTPTATNDGAVTQ